MLNQHIIFWDTQIPSLHLITCIIIYRFTLHYRLHSNANCLGIWVLQPWFWQSVWFRWITNSHFRMLLAVGIGLYLSFSDLAASILWLLLWKTLICLEVHLICPSKRSWMLVVRSQISHCHNRAPQLKTEVKAHVSFTAIWACYEPLFNAAEQNGHDVKSFLPRLQSKVDF